MVYWIDLCLQGHDGQREAECSAVSAPAQQDLSGPGAHGGMDRTSGAPAQRPAPGKTDPSPFRSLRSLNKCVMCSPGV